MMLLRLILVFFVPSIHHLISSPTFFFANAAKTGNKGTNKMTKLWKDAETKDLLESTNAMKKLFELKLDQKDPTRFQRVTQRISQLVGENLNLAIDYSNKRKFYESSEIYRTILENLGTMIDETNRRYCQDQYAETVYRQALGGYREWSELEKILKSIENRTPYQDYLIHFAQKNTANKMANWKPKRETYKRSHTLPYVLRFHTPQKYHTPTLAHFGHTMLDGLFPFTLAYANNTFQRAIENQAPIYVLDIGLYLLPLLQTIYSNLTFIPFTSHGQLPEFYEPIDLTGVGFFEYTPGEEIVDPYKTLAGNQALTTIRDVVFTQLGVTPLPRCIVMISRKLQDQNLQAFHQKHLLDESHEAPGMKEYHDVGPGVHTAFYYYATTAHERRMLLNEQQVFHDLVTIFHKKYKQCVQLVQLDKLSIREQFLTFMNAKIIIGQHGAALTYSGFLSNDPLNRGILIELDPQYNWNFKLECDGMGVEYHHLQRDEYPGLYKTEDNVNIELSSKHLIKIIKEYLRNWKGYQEKKVQESALKMKEVFGQYWNTMYGLGVYNGTSASPSIESIQESNEYLRRSSEGLDRIDRSTFHDDEDDDYKDQDDSDDDDNDESNEYDEDDDLENEKPIPTRVEVCTMMKDGRKECRWK